jgi:DNA-binding transcriptional regulator LsrR (DeoR family)
VVQVSGSSLSDELSSPEFCTALIANRLGAKCENLHAPAILSSPGMRDALVAEPGIARQLARVRACDLVALGVGELDGSVHFSDGQFLTAAVVADYMARAAVGVVLGRFIDRAGREVEGPLSGRQIGMELAELRAIPERICVAGGRAKVGPIRALLAGGYVTQLVTDAATARALLEET